jgi:hypothetical protein
MLLGDDVNKLHGILDDQKAAIERARVILVARQHAARQQELRVPLDDKGLFVLGGQRHVVARGKVVVSTSTSALPRNMMLILCFCSVNKLVVFVLDQVLIDIGSG